MILGLVIGIVIGVFAGVFVMALAMAAGRDSEIREKEGFNKEHDTD